MKGFPIAFMLVVLFPAPFLAVLGIERSVTNADSRVGSDTASPLRGRVIRFNTRPQFVETSVRGCPSGTQWPGTPWPAMQSGDLDGDGRSDLAAVSKDEIVVWYAPHDLPDGFLLRRYKLTNTGIDFGLAAVGDSDLDGRSEILSTCAPSEKVSWCMFRFDDNRELTVEFGADVALDLRGGALRLTGPRETENGMGFFALSPSDGWKRIAGSWNQFTISPAAAPFASGRFLRDAGGFATWIYSTGGDELIAPPPARFKFVPLSDAKSKTPIVADINGDNLDDILMYRGKVAGWFVALATGRDFLWWIPIGIPVEVEPDLVRVGDFDGDGSADLLIPRGQRAECGVLVSTSAHGVEGRRFMSSSGLEVQSDSGGRFSFGDSSNSIETVRAVGEVDPIHPTEIRINALNRAHGLRFVVNPPASSGDHAGGILPLDVRNSGPKVCLGFQSGQWDEHTHKFWGRSYRCVSGAIPFEIDDPPRTSRSVSKFPYLVSCCRLPADDILTKQILQAPNHCPDDYVATSNISIEGEEGESNILECTKINISRYQLGPARPGVYWGIGASGGGGKGQIWKNEIPLAIRYGMGRESETGWDIDGCIGDPAGSLPVSKGRGDCNQVSFRELQYRGRDGDPVAGTPVKMFPDCLSMNDIFDPYSGCRISRK